MAAAVEGGTGKNGKRARGRATAAGGGSASLETTLSGFNRTVEDLNIHQGEPIRTIGRPS